METQAKAILRKKEDRRIRSGHLWIFSNELERIEGTPINGDFVEVIDHSGRLLGIGFWNGNSLIAIRMISRKPFDSFRELVRGRMRRADDFRAAVSYENSYRLVFGESDFLPGLVIDRYNDVFVLESFSAGADRIVPIAVEWLQDTFSPKSVFEKSDSQWRSYEGLQVQTGFLLGTDGATTVNINGMSYIINVLAAQKTGFFLDQRENRLLVETISRGKRVLDCFCNDGGFALHATRGGAISVVGLDISSDAVKRAEANAGRNGIAGVAFHVADVFESLNASLKDNYDMIILDPPAFVRSKNRLASGLKGYQKLNERAMWLLPEGGTLVTCSCSQHVTEDVFLDMLKRSARNQNKYLRIFAVRGAALDHPVLASMPETQYLTFVATTVHSL
ncbi:MAG: class I SAM-dependent rRNA methyltransferase [Ignavibacteriae bacterium]|nr:class I SAM-dependent rRNA methyltransferase [Ignavibacteriota bacterium]